MAVESWRCFVGLPLPPGHHQALDREAGRLADALTSRIGFTRPGNWHLTLRFLGEVDRRALPELLHALGGVRFTPFEIVLGAAGSFPPLARKGLGRPPQALWAGLARGAEDCVALAADIIAALARAGFPPEDRPLRPHVTLGRVRRAEPGDDWAAALAALRIAEPDFMADRFVLWRSILGPSGPSYQPLAEYPAAS